jgi:hypothetical protein
MRGEMRGKRRGERKEKSKAMQQPRRLSLLSSPRDILFAEATSNSAVLGGMRSIHSHDTAGPATEVVERAVFDGGCGAAECTKPICTTIVDA